MMILRKALFICRGEKLFCQKQFLGLVLFCSKHQESKRESAVTLLSITRGDSEGRDEGMVGDEVGFKMEVWKVIAHKKVTEDWCREG